ncbi:uncharacterized protein LOC130898270 [Diorhabda carinulata]|uniref:uncharacterized protein LOC130448639 n=1 Tax=Diorhabda sublineata TaxID=1163346 RepID=UPI0024E16E08|nr:uncharacterized protein LOC130448639 [Diorhabda sublineata]XP_057663422.1 uncharacterized protein LOC130898270 [Diorhabda carinulata]
MQAAYHFIFRCLLIILTASLIVTSARHLGDDNLEENNQFADVESNQLGSGLKPWQMELLAQKLAMAELNNNQLRYPEYIQDSEPRLNLADILYSNSRFQRNLRSSNKNNDNRKRGSRCYFNAVSCFGKK